jgi:hypothetical protein
MSLPKPEDDEEEDVPHFSLVTGKLVYSETSRPMRTRAANVAIEYDDSGDKEAALVKRETQVAVREDGIVSVRGVRSLAAEMLVGRSWKGLDGTGKATGEDGAEVEIGRDGVARGYRSSDNTAR